MVWDFKGEEGSSHGDGEAKVCKQVFAGPVETVGHGVDPDLQALLSFPHATWSIVFADIFGDALFQKEPLYLNYFRQLRGWSKFLP